MQFGLPSGNVFFYDLDGNGTVDLGDRDERLRLAGSLLGDANLDGEVNFPDFLALSANFGGTGGWGEGDFDADGKVRFADFLILSSNFGLVGEQIARCVVEFLSVDRGQRASWVRKHFGPDYPSELSPHEVTCDIISRAVNSAEFSCTFRCPKCDRLALAVPPDHDTWKISHLLRHLLIAGNDRRERLLGTLILRRQFGTAHPAKYRNN